MCTGIVHNELIGGHTNVVDTKFKFIPSTHTHTCVVMPFKDHEPTELKVDIATLSVASGSSALNRHTSVGSAGLGPWSSVYRTSGGSMIFTIPRNCTVHCISYCNIRFTS